MGKFEEAEEMFYIGTQQEEEGKDHECPICLYNMGNGSFLKQDFKQAIWCWEKVAKLEPTHPEINLHLARAHWATGNFSLADKHFHKELCNDGGDELVLLNFGIFLLEREKFDSAKRMFERILERYKDYSDEEYEVHYIHPPDHIITHSCHGMSFLDLNE